jgi:hypothetical protein
MTVSGAERHSRSAISVSSAATAANVTSSAQPMSRRGWRRAICHLPDEWNGADLALVLDHVDGDSTNNARGNLRLICPNCDSQLPTYKSKNKGKGRAWRRQRYADGKSY